MKTLLYAIIMSSYISTFAFADTCPCCGQEILPVVTTEIQIKKDLKDRIIEWIEIQKIDGIVTQKRVDSYNYYPSGEVNQIDLKIYNDKEKLLKHKKITHYKDGKQPVIENVAIEVPKL